MGGGRGRPSSVDSVCHDRAGVQYCYRAGSIFTFVYLAQLATERSVEDHVSRARGGASAMKPTRGAITCSGGRDDDCDKTSGSGARSWHGAVRPHRPSPSDRPGAFRRWMCRPEPSTSRHRRSVEYWGASRPGFAMVTCDPNELVAPIHPKAMITVLEEADWDRWLTGSYDDAVALQQPYAVDRMTVRGPVFPTRAAKV